jgi:hypothetical protein
MDWRANIKDHNTLDDLNPIELMIYLRHQYLESAKDLIKSNHKDDVSYGIQCSMTAENIQHAIETFTGQ